MIPCYKKHDMSFIWYYYEYHISKAILDLDPDLCQNFLLFISSSILHIETCVIPLSKAVDKETEILSRSILFLLLLYFIIYLFIYYSVKL